MAGTEPDPRPLREGKEIRGTRSMTHGVCSLLAAEEAADQGLERHLAVEEVEAHLQEAADRQIHGRESQDHRAVCSGVRTFSAWTSSMGT